MGFIFFFLTLFVAIHLIFLIPLSMMEGKDAKNNQYHRPNSYDNEYRYFPMRFGYDLGYRLALNETRFAARKQAVRDRNKNRMQNR